MPSERKAGSGLVTAVVREAQVHPWRTIEHCILIVLALHLTFNSKPVSAPICAAGTSEPNRIAALRHATVFILLYANQKPCKIPTC